MHFVGFEDFKLYSPTIELGMGSTGSTIMLEIVLDDFRNSEDAVESFILQLLHSADILPQNVVLGTAVIRVMDVGMYNTDFSCVTLFLPTEV